MENCLMDVKAAGFWCAWSERYYVRNVGHEVAEFEATLSIIKRTTPTSRGWESKAGKLASRCRSPNLRSIANQLSSRIG